MSRWPETSSWDFVAVDRGHDVAFWRELLRALERIDPDMAVNIEHSDQELDQTEGCGAPPGPSLRRRASPSGPGPVLGHPRRGRLVPRR